MKQFPCGGSYSLEKDNIWSFDDYRKYLEDKETGESLHVIIIGQTLQTLRRSFSLSWIGGSTTLPRQAGATIETISCVPALLL